MVTVMMRKGILFEFSGNRQRKSVQPIEVNRPSYYPWYTISKGSRMIGIKGFTEKIFLRINSFSDNVDDRERKSVF